MESLVSVKANPENHCQWNIEISVIHAIKLYRLECFNAMLQHTKAKCTNILLNWPGQGIQKLVSTLFRIGLIQSGDTDHWTMSQQGIPFLQANKVYQLFDIKGFTRFLKYKLNPYLPSRMHKLKVFLLAQITNNNHIVFWLEGNHPPKAIL